MTIHNVRLQNGTLQNLPPKYVVFFEQGFDLEETSEGDFIMRRHEPDDTEDDEDFSWINDVDLNANGDLSDENIAFREGENGSFGFRFKNPVPATLIVESIKQINNEEDEIIRNSSSE